MTRKKRRLYLVGLGMLLLAGATALVLTAFEDSLVFFFSPTEVKERHMDSDRRFRMGGLVVEGSVVRDGDTVQFDVTDTNESLTIRYQGILPDLFREGQGIVAEGRMTPDGVFQAAEVLAKHDENYMPAEVADALKAAGHWQEEAQAAAEAAAEATPAPAGNSTPNEYGSQ